MFKLSVPTKTQLVHLVDRALVAFVLACAAFLKGTTDPTSKVALIGAVTAGAVAVWQLIVAFLTTI